MEPKHGADGREREKARERDEDLLEPRRDEPMAVPRSDVKRRTPGGTGIGRDLDH